MRCARHEQESHGQLLGFFFLDTWQGQRIGSGLRMILEREGFVKLVRGDHRRPTAVFLPKMLDLKGMWQGSRLL